MGSKGLWERSRGLGCGAGAWRPTDAGWLSGKTASGAPSPPRGPMDRRHLCVLGDPWESTGLAEPLAAAGQLWTLVHPLR